MTKELTVEEIQKIIAFFRQHWPNEIDLFQDMDEVLKILNNTGDACFGSSKEGQYWLNQLSDGGFTISQKTDKDIFVIHKDMIREII